MYRKVRLIATFVVASKSNDVSIWYFVSHVGGLALELCLLGSKLVCSEKNVGTVSVG